jgi:hypothetical protein
LRARPWQCLILVLAPFALGSAEALTEADRLRTRLGEYDAETRSIEAEWRKVRAEADGVAAEIAALDRQPSLGPVERRRYSNLRQRSQDLSETLSFLEAREARVREAYERDVGRLVELLGPEIALLKEAFQAEPVESEARASLFGRYEALVAERRGLQATISPEIKFLRVEVEIEAGDTPRRLRDKAALVADNRDLIARVLRALAAWKRELLEDREILNEVRLLQTENDFFRITDPLEAPPGGGEPRLERLVAVPRGLGEFSSRFVLPPEGLMRAEDFDPLIESIARIEVELGDYVVEMDAKRQRFVDEAASREGSE